MSGERCPVCGKFYVRIWTHIFKKHRRSKYFRELLMPELIRDLQEGWAGDEDAEEA